MAMRQPGSKTSIIGLTQGADPSSGQPWALFFRDHQTGDVTEIAPFAHEPYLGGPGLAVAPDGQTILYAAWTRGQSDLMLVEGFQ